MASVRDFSLNYLCIFIGFCCFQDEQSLYNRIKFIKAFAIIFALIGLLVRHLFASFNKQSRLVDTFMYDLVKLKIVEDTKHFKRVAYDKSRYHFQLYIKFPDQHQPLQYLEIRQLGL